MKAEQYKELSFGEQADIILAHGRPVANRQYYGQDVILFLVHDFFVEAWYSDADKDLTDIKVLPNEKALSLYGRDIGDKD